MFPAFDQRGDAHRGDFDGTGAGTIASTSAGYAQLATRSAPKPSHVGATAALPTSSLAIGLVAFGGLLVLLKVRKVI